MKKHNPFFAALFAVVFIFSSYSLAETPTKDLKNTTHPSTKPQAATQHAVKKAGTKATGQHTTAKTETNNRSKVAKSTVVKKTNTNQNKKIAKQSSANKLNSKQIANNKKPGAQKTAGTKTTTHHLTKNHTKKKVIKPKQTSAT